MLAELGIVKQKTDTGNSAFHDGGGGWALGSKVLGNSRVSIWYGEVFKVETAITQCCPRE